MIGFPFRRRRTAFVVVCTASPLPSKPLANWDSLTVQEKHDVAAEMIDVIYISHNDDKMIEVIYGI